MPRLVKIGIILAAVAAVFCIALIILIQTQLTPERVRATLLPLVENQLDRKIDVGDIDIGLFSGVTVNDLNIMEADGERSFLSVGSSRVSYKLWPLFRGQLLIREITFDQPVITVIRHTDGQFNFSDLLPQPSTPATDSRQPEVAPSASGVDTMLDLLIQVISIRDGQIHFIDHSINPAAPFRYSLHQLDFRARQITLDKAFPVDLSVVLNNTKVDLSGQFDVARNAGVMVLRMAPLDLVPFAPYYRDAVPGNLGAARLSLNVDLDFSAQRLLSRGKITLDQVDLVLADLPDAPLRGARLTADYALTFDPDRQRLDISTLLLQVNDIKAAMQGHLDLAPAQPHLDAQLSLDRLDLRQAISSLPQALSRQLQPFSPAGELDARMRLLGSVSAGAKLVDSAQIKLTAVQATIDTLRAGISGDINYGQESLRSDNLNVRYGDQQAQLNFVLTDVLNRPVGGRFALTARDLNIDQLFPDTAEASPAAGQPSSSPQATELGPYDLPLALNGTLNIERMLYRRLVIQPFSAALELKNNRLTIDPLAGRVAGGQFSLTSIIDLGVKGLAYQGELAMSQADLATLVRGLFPETKQQLGGQLQWVNSFSGRGTIKETLLKALQLEGEVKLLQGAVSGVTMLDQVAWFLDSPDLKALTFRGFQGSYRLRNGRAQLDSQMDGSQVRMAPKGTVGVDGSLDLQLETRLSPDVMGRMGASDRLKQAFVDSSGWGVLPLQVSGNLTSPQVGFNTEALQKQALEQATQAVEERLRDRLLPESDAAGRESMRNLLDNTLRRLRTP